MSRFERAQEIVEEIRDILTLAGMDDVEVVDTPQGITAPALRGGVIAIGPPAIDWETRTVSVNTWTLLIVAGPAHDSREAWRRLDRIVDLLAEHRSLEKATPGSYSHQNGTLPAYTITTTDE